MRGTKNRTVRDQGLRIYGFESSSNVGALKVLKGVLGSVIVWLWQGTLGITY